MKKTWMILCMSVILLAFNAVAVLAESAHAQDTAKPNVAILATGGTIASRGTNSLALTDYGRGAGMNPVGIQMLIDAVPEIQNFAHITGEQVFNVGSS